MHRGAIVAIVLFFAPLLAFADTCPSLSLGSTGTSVKAVQQILFDAYQGFPAPSGYFGSITQAALKQWQKEHGLEAVGSVGPKTAAAMKLCMATGSTNISVPAAVTNTNAAPNSLPSISRTLSRGLSGTDVVALQQLLISQKLLPADSATGFFGVLTEAAVQAFQRSKGISSSGTPATTGYGAVGPKTRIAITTSSFSSTATISGTTASSVVMPSQSQASVPSGGAAISTGAPSSPGPGSAASVSSTASSGGGGGGGGGSASGSLPPASCSFNGQAMASGSTVVAYAESGVAYGQACISQVRVCASGTLSGTYGNASCAIAPAPVVAPTTPPQRTVSSQTSLSILPSVLQYASTEVMDFLLQDVCTDSSDVPIAGDPAVCPRHRDIRFGEFIPYIHTDYVPNLGGSASSWYTYPTQAFDGSLLVMKIHEWGGKVQNTSYKDFDTISPSDGIDLIEANGSHVSIIATQNNVQPLSPLWNPSCSYDDTWKLFPTSLTVGAVGTATSSLAFGATCPSSFATALNVWHYYTPAEPTVYISGKRLTSLIEWHYDAADPRQAGSFEQMYFTKEYGVSRWEAWQTVENCLNYVVPNTPGLTAGYCAAGRTPQCNGVDKLSNVWGKDYIRVDCHDLTYTKDYDTFLNPLINPTGGNMVLAKNLLVFGDFAQGQSTGWKSGAANTVSQTFKKNADNNWYLQMQCSGQCVATSGVYQDVSVAYLTGKKKILFGALLKATTDTGAYISIDLLDAQGNRISGRKTLFRVTNASTHSGDFLVWDFSAQPVQTIRFQMTLTDTSVSYDVDEAYVTPTIAGGNELLTQGN